MFGVNRAPILHQDWQYLQTDQNEVLLEPHHLGVSSGVSKMISEPMVCSAQTVHSLAPMLTPSLIGLKQDSTWPTSPRSSIGCVQNNCWANGTFVVNHAPFCVNVSTISKRIETSFHLNLVTSEYHGVRPKQLLSLWYVWHKSCTYLALTLTPSPNGPKWELTWPASPRGSIGCVQNDFCAYGTFSTNCASILC
jgi:hypothetical protein